MGEGFDWVGKLGVVDCGEIECEEVDRIVKRKI